MIAALALVLPILLSVAFMTLIERKGLAALQRRVGPNTVGVLGLLQPFADALKLISKESVVPGHSSSWLFLIAPVITLLFSLLGWAVVPFAPGVELVSMHLSVLYSLALSSLGVYGTLLAGWSANSTYAFLGSLRSAAQMVSYELVFSASVLCIALAGGSFSYSVLVEQQVTWYLVPLLPVAGLFAISALAETNRTPFDLQEAESELVAGFFTEHSSVPFVLFFLAEYGSIVLVSVLTALLFLGGYPSNVPLLVASLVLGVKSTAVALGFVWVRATLPRLRYDALMELCWTELLPLAMGCVVLVPSVLVAWDALNRNRI